MSATDRLQEVFTGRSPNISDAPTADIRRGASGAAGAMEAGRAAERHRRGAGPSAKNGICHDPESWRDPGAPPPAGRVGAQRRQAGADVSQHLNSPLHSNQEGNCSCRPTHVDPGGPEAGADRFPADARCRLVPPGRPAEQAKRDHLLLFGGVQDVAHGGERHLAGRPASESSARQPWWPVFRCPLVAGFGGYQGACFRV